MLEHATPRKQAWLSKPAEFYARVCRPDRDFSSDRNRNPFIAGLCGMLFPGLGQIYNRQYVRGIWWIAIVMLVLVVCGFVLLLEWWPFSPQQTGWRGWVGQAFSQSHIGIWIILVGLWIAALVAAIVTAVRLRRGSLVVRFSKSKQLMMALASMTPFAGAITPDETCSPDELDPQLSKVVIGKIIHKMIARKLWRLVMAGVVAFGVLPVLIGCLMAWPVMVILGALIILGALVAVLIG